MQPVKREKQSLSEIEEMDTIPRSKEIKTEYSMYPGSNHHRMMDETSDMNSENKGKNLSEKLSQNRQNFLNWANSLDEELREQIIDVKELQQDLKIKYDSIPGYRGIIQLYEKDIQKMLTNKQEKKNWNEDDIMILIWIIIKYNQKHGKTFKSLSDEDWRFIATLIPGKSHESAKFKLLQMLKCTIQVAPWTKEENQILVKLVEEKGRKAWQDISKILYTESSTKTYRSSKQCREHYNNHLDPNVKKGTWNKEEDLELLKLAKEKGKKWSEIARLLNGRTENSVKNRYHALFRKEIEKNEEYLSKKTSMNDQNMSQNEQSMVQQQIMQNNTISENSKDQQGMIDKLICSYQQQLQINGNDVKQSESSRSPQASMQNSKSQNNQENEEIKMQQGSGAYLPDSKNIIGMPNYQIGQNQGNNQQILPLGQLQQQQQQPQQNNQGYMNKLNLFTVNNMYPQQNQYLFQNMIYPQQASNSQFQGQQSGQQQGIQQNQQQSSFNQMLFSQPQFIGSGPFISNSNQNIIGQQYYNTNNVNQVSNKEGKERENYQQSSDNTNNQNNRSSTCSIETHVKNAKSGNEVKKEIKQEGQVKKITVKDMSELEKSDMTSYLQALYHPQKNELYVCNVYSGQNSQIMPQSSASLIALNCNSQSNFPVQQLQQQNLQHQQQQQGSFNTQQQSNSQNQSNNQILGQQQAYLAQQPIFYTMNQGNTSDISIQSHQLSMQQGQPILGQNLEYQNGIFQNSMNSMVTQNNINTQGILGPINSNKVVFDSSKNFEMNNFNFQGNTNNYDSIKGSEAQIEQGNINNNINNQNNNSSSNNLNSNQMGIMSNQGNINNNGTNNQFGQGNQNFKHQSFNNIQQSQNNNQQFFSPNQNNFQNNFNNQYQFNTGNQFGQQQQQQQQQQQHQQLSKSNGQIQNQNLNSGIQNNNNNNINNGNQNINNTNNFGNLNGNQGYQNGGNNNNVKKNSSFQRFSREQQQHQNEQMNQQQQQMQNLYNNHNNINLNNNNNYNNNNYPKIQGEFAIIKQSSNNASSSQISEQK